MCVGGGIGTYTQKIQGAHYLSLCSLCMYWINFFSVDQDVDESINDTFNNTFVMTMLNFYWIIFYSSKMVCIFLINGLEPYHDANNTDTLDHCIVAPIWRKLAILIYVSWDLFLKRANRCARSKRMCCCFLEMHQDIFVCGIIDEFVFDCKRQWQKSKAIWLNKDLFGHWTVETCIIKAYYIFLQRRLKWLVSLFMESCIVSYQFTVLWYM